MDVDSDSGTGIFRVPMTWNVHLAGGGKSPLQIYCKITPLDIDMLNFVDDLKEIFVNTFHKVWFLKNFPMSVYALNSTDI